MNIREKRLKNDLLILSEEMPHLRSVSIGVWVRGGSRSESARESGISHFIEHLLFKGTRTRSARDIAKTIDGVGGQLNAFTDREYVGFYATVLDSHMPLAFELLSDIVLNPTFPGAEIERERNVIYEEISMVEDSPADLVHDILFEAFWPKHPLGRPISGTKQSVRRITRTDVLSRYRSNYTGCNTLLSVAGNVRHGRVLRLAEEYFGRLHTGSAISLGTTPVSTPAWVVRRKSNLEQTHLCVGTRCPSMTSDDRFAVHVLNNILGGGLSSRLFQNVRERRGLVYNIYSGVHAYMDAGTMIVYAGMAPGAAAEVLDLTLREMARLRERQVPEEELRRSKENLKGALMLSLESSSSRMSHLAQQQMYHGRVYGLEEIIQNVERTTARDIRRLACEMFDPSTVALSALADRAHNKLKLHPSRP